MISLAHQLLYTSANYNLTAKNVKMPETFNTRETLLKRLKNRHDEKSWEEFDAIYRPFLMAVANDMHLQRHQSEDLVQLVMLKAWEKLPEFTYLSSKGRFRNWLAVILKNMIKRHLSREGRISLTGISLEDEKQVAPALDDIIEKEWQVYVVELAWEKIQKRFSPKTIEVFKLFSEGLTGPQVAEKSGVALETCYVYKKRVQKILMRKINSLDDALG